MAENASVEKLIRCPICLKLLAVPDGLAANSRVTCQSCKHPFSLDSALPTKSQLAAPGNSEVPLATPATTTPLDLFYALPIFQQFIGCAGFVAVLVLVLSVPGTAMLGPAFLVYFGGILICGLILCAVLRANWGDQRVITLCGFLVYEGIGTVRLFWGVAHGMHKFDIMLAMMIFGGFLFFARASTLSNMNSSGSGCSSSCSGGGGGCGSSCGGGGCGGCGS